MKREIHHIGAIGMVLMVTCLPLVSMAQIIITTQDEICYGDKNGAILIFVPNATEPVTYNWADGASGSTRLNLTQGTYTVTITDATGCDHIKIITVDGPDRPLDMLIQTRPPPHPIECHTTVPVVVAVLVSGGTGPHTINGERGVIFKEFTFGATTEFIFSVRDDHGCREEKKRLIHVGEFKCSYDPNDIAGPTGYHTPHWVSVHDTLPYTVRFENDPELASAPAKTVFISHAFDEDINPYTFRLGTFGFGDHSFEVPVNASSFQKRYDFITEHGFYVDVVAGLDVQNNQAFWQMTTIDPLTNQPPADPLIGFLPVNDTITRSGEGFVSFTVKPKANTMTGDTVEANASIIFDVNEPINTNTWTNLIDALPPVTLLESLDSITTNNMLQLSWTGSDDPGGSGIGFYELFVSKDDTPFEKALVTVADSLTYTFEGEYGAQYQFYIIGVDNTGNREVKDSTEASVYILPNWNIQVSPISQDVYCVQDTMVLHYTTILVDTVNIVLFEVEEERYTPLAMGIDTAVNPFIWSVPDSLAGSTIRVFVIASDSLSIQDSSRNFLVRDLPAVYAGPDRDVCPDEWVSLIPGGANSYYWSPQIGLNFQSNTVQSFRADTSVMYFVEGTDVYGCINTDSIVITVHPTYLDTVTYLMCNQDSLFVGGSYQKEPGFYTDELASAFGCDSTVVTEIVLTGPCPFPSPQIYVDKDATGLNNGTSWANAFVELKDALQAAEEWGGADEIWIAEGVYTPHPTRRDTSFILNDSTKLYGGFLGIELARSERTGDAALVQISGDINVIDTLWDNSYHTVVLTDQCISCIIDGVTITYGHANQPTNSNDIGGGVLNFGIGYFNNVLFERNFATDMGSAIYSSGITASLIIEGCIFQLNTSSLGRDLMNVSGAQVEFRGANSIH